MPEDVSEEWCRGKPDPEPPKNWGWAWTALLTGLDGGLPDRVQDVA